MLTGCRHIQKQNAWPGLKQRFAMDTSSGYFRANTITFGLSRPGTRVVIVKVFRSAESAISLVAVTFPPALSVISSARAFTRRTEEEAPRPAFGPSLG